VNVVGLPELLRLVRLSSCRLGGQGSIASTLPSLHLELHQGQFGDEGFQSTDCAFWNRIREGQRKEFMTRRRSCFQEKGCPLLKSQVELLSDDLQSRSPRCFPLPGVTSTSSAWVWLIPILTSLVGGGHLRQKNHCVWPDGQPARSPTAPSGQLPFLSNFKALHPSFSS
jgi:hypothetical protein